MNDLTTGRFNQPAHNIHLTLRVASAMCFIGHGTFGIITKSIWCNYFAVFGIGPDLAYRLMPFLGSIDILLGLSVLLYPTRTVLSWLVIWGIVTGLLRPLSGEPFGEFIERAGNYGAPLALLLLSGPQRWFSKLDAYPQPDKARFAKVVFCLRVVVFLLLLGHGWLNLMDKKGPLGQYAAVGIFEIVAAVALLVKPVRPLLMVLFVWKMATELFYPHWEAFEWVERGGSYGSLLALWLALGAYKHSVTTKTNQKLASL
jgi:hypothetical protein